MCFHPFLVLPSNRVSFNSVFPLFSFLSVPCQSLLPRQFSFILLTIFLDISLFRFGVVCVLTLLMFSYFKNHRLLLNLTYFCISFSNLFQFQEHLTTPSSSFHSSFLFSPIFLCFFLFFKYANSRMMSELLTEYIYNKQVFHFYLLIIQSSHSA